MRRASQWLQYEGLRYAVEATLRRGAGTIPWQLNEPYPNAWCTAAVDHRGDPKPAYYGVARAYRRDWRSARFATSAWAGHDAARAEVDGPARFVGVDGAVVVERADAGELEAPLDAFGSDLFFLVLGSNRYLMSRTDDLAPLLDLEPADVEVERDGDRLRLRHTAGPAAVGIVLEDARPYDAAGWVVFSDNVVDLLPGESREVELSGPVGELRVEGWNARG
jgi:beta-mannosidase